jgi:Nucleotidyl transferase AbiEii toxin, Type IV TA system
VQEFSPHLEVLPAAQSRLWSELSAVPKEFVLYGGTALALRLGHRTSVDFDFSGKDVLNLPKLEAAIPFLVGAKIFQRKEHALTAPVNRGGFVKVSFFGVPKLPRLAPPHKSGDIHLQVRFADLVRSFPGIKQFNSRSLEVLGVSRRYNESMLRRNRGDRTICKVHGVAGCLRLREDAGEGNSGVWVKGQHATLKQWQHLIRDRVVQVRATLPRGQQFNACTQFSDIDRSQIERRRCLAIQPLQDVTIGARPQRLGNDVRIKNNHAKRAGFTTLRFCDVASTTPPNLRPTLAKADPRPIGERTASASISRISASVLRPPLAARSLSALKVSSGRFLTVTAAIVSTPDQ